MPLRVEVFESISLRRQAQLVESIDDKRLSELIEWMSSDDRVDLLSQIPDHRREHAIRLVAQAERNDIRRLLCCAKGTAGSQSATLFIRMFALQPANSSVQRDPISRALIARELVVGLALGSGLAILDFSVARFWFRRSVAESVAIAAKVVTVVFPGTSAGLSCRSSSVGLA